MIRTSMGPSAVDKNGCSPAIGAPIMTTLATQRQLLLTMGEAVTKDRLTETAELGVGVVRVLRENVARGRQQFEEYLTKGIEARLLAHSYGPLLPATDQYLVQLGQLLDELSGAEETPAARFAAEVRLLETEVKSFRGRLAAALSLASKPPPPVDWKRLKEEADADFAAGRFTSFESAEDMLKGLVGND